MVTTNYGKSGLALLMTGSSTQPQYCAIGSGSGADVPTLGSLVAEVLATRTAFTTRSTSTANKVNMVFDFSSTSMSGLNLREFGVAGSQAKNSQTLWNREAFPAVTFDGSNELQVDVTYEVF